MSLTKKALILTLLSSLLTQTVIAEETVKLENFKPPKNDYGKHIYPFAPYSTNKINDRVKALSEDSSPIINFNTIISKSLSSRTTTSAINKGQQAWMSTYWPLNQGLIANPYQPNASINIVNEYLRWTPHHKRLEKRIRKVLPKWRSLDQDELDQMSPAEKYDLLLGDENFTMTKKVVKYMYNWGSKKENAFLTKVDKVGMNTLQVANNYVTNEWLNGDDRPFADQEEALPLAIKNKGGIADAIAQYLIEDGKAYTYEEALKKATPLAKREAHNYVIKDKNSLMASWEGICHGWSTAAGIVPRPNKIVTFKLDNGKNLRFYPDDLKALASYMFANSKIQDGRVTDKETGKTTGGILMQGLRCNDSKPGVDPWGRFYDDRKDAFSDKLEARCVGVHPAIWHLSLVNIIGNQGRSFVVERKISEGVDNHPMYGYKAEYFDPYTGEYEGRIQNNIRPITDKDQFVKWRNPEATHIVGVRLTMTYVNWKRPKRESYDSRSKDEMRDIEMIYDLELDKNMNIVGGQWRAVEKGRGIMQKKERKQPDFFWVVTKNYKPFFKENKALPSWDGKSLPPKEYLEASIKTTNQKYPTYHDRCEVEKKKSTKLNANLPKYIKVNCQHNYDKPQPLIDVVRMLIKRSNNEGKTF